MKKIDAVGQACPMPVILTKRALKESNGETVLIRVDNEIATQNLAKMAEQLKLSVQVEKINDSLYEVQLSDPNAGNEPHAAKHTVIPEQAAETVASSGASYVVVLNSDFIGNGSEELGRTLMKSFLFSLTEQEVLPEKVLCYNAGALLTTEGSAVSGRPQSAGGRRRRGADLRYLWGILWREGQIGGRHFYEHVPHR